MNNTNFGVRKMFGFKLVKKREWTKLNADLKLANMKVDIWESNYEEMKDMYKKTHKTACDLGKEVTELEKELEQLESEKNELENYFKAERLWD